MTVQTSKRSFREMLECRSLREWFTSRKRTKCNADFIDTLSAAIDPLATWPTHPRRGHVATVARIRGSGTTRLINACAIYAAFFNECDVPPRVVVLCQNWVQCHNSFSMIWRVLTSHTDMLHIDGRSMRLGTAEISVMTLAKFALFRSSRRGRPILVLSDCIDFDTQLSKLPADDQAGIRRLFTTQSGRLPSAVIVENTH